MDHTLAMVSLHNLPDNVDPKAMPDARGFGRNVSKMEGFKGTIDMANEARARRWARCRKPNPVKARTMEQIMSSATLGQVSPLKHEPKFTEDRDEGGCLKSQRRGDARTCTIL